MAYIITEITVAIADLKKNKTGERKKDIITPKQAENNIAFTISVNENVI